MSATGDGPKDTEPLSGAKAPRGIVLFTEGPVQKHMSRMSIPMLWGLLATVGASLADAYYLGRLGTAHLAAITFAFPIIMLLSNLTLGLGSGFASLLARALGEGDNSKVQKLTISAMLLSVFLVLVLSVIGFLTIDPMFRAMGAGSTILPLIKEYMSIWYIAMVFVVVPMTGNFALRASGNPKSASTVMITSALINIVADPIFIFGFLFIPGMGMKGAAIAGVISRLVSFAITFHILVNKKRMVVAKFPPLAHMFDDWRDILKIGGPLALTNMVTPFSVAIVTFLLAQYGKEVVAGFGIATRIEALAAIPLMAVASSISPIVGQNFGAGLYARVATTIKVGFVFYTVYGIAAAIVLALLRKTLPGFFDSNPEVIVVAALYLLVAPVGYVAMGWSMAVGASYTGMGNPKPSVTMSLTRMIVLYIPLAIMGSFLFGPLGIFAAGTVASFLVGFGAIAFVRWKARLAISAGQLSDFDVKFSLPRVLAKGSNRKT
jgi:MATE family, multidrug efflux pump